MRFTVGEFTVTVGVDGYPVWVEIWDVQKNVLRLSHLQLRDLQYAVKKARREAKRVMMTNDVLGGSE